MLINYFLKVAVRNIVKRKVFSIINVGSMALGLTVCLLAILWIQEEIQFDTFHANGKNIAQVYSEIRTSDGRQQTFTGSYFPLAKELGEKAPEVAATSRFKTTRGLNIRAGEKSFTEDVVALADASFFRMFTFPFVSGDPRTALAEKYSIVISENMRRKYFGAENPIGKILNVADSYDLTVTGVIQDVPRQSSLQFDGVVPFVLQFAPNFQEPSHWGGNPLTTYILMSPGAAQKEVAAKVNRITAEHFQLPGYQVTFHLLPFLRKHLHDPETNLAQMLLLFSLVALLELVIACVNFMNLSTAMAATRAKEVGVRTAVGARRTDIIKQFLGESLVLSYIALGIALALLYLILPQFNRIAGKMLSMRMILEPAVFLGFLGITVFAAFLAGSYPAFCLSRIQPKTIIQGKVFAGSQGTWGNRLRKYLVVFQFALSIVLILATIAISAQMQFIKNKNLGFDQRNLVSLRLGENLTGQYASLKTELLRNPAITGITAGCQNPMNISSSVSALDWEGKNPNESFSMHFDWIDYNYFETFNIPVAIGRSFSEKFPADEKEGYIVNESAVKMMGMKDPVGQSLSVFKKQGRIIGVVKDFHFRPLRYQIRPIVFLLKPSAIQNVFIRINPAATAEALQHIENTYKQFDPQRSLTFQYIFFDEQMMQSQYSVEANIQRIALIFTSLAVIIACAGLFGLAAFLTEQRTKEVGIRKVLGASAAQITLMLSKEFTQWVLLANLFAWPIAYFLVRQLLAMYAYSAAFGIQYYLFTGGVTFIISILTVGLLTMKAAQSNPIDSLRYE